MPRFFCPTPLAAGAQLDLPPGAARHVQVLRLQPGAPITLFDGRGGEWLAQVERMGRGDVTVQVVSHDPVEREAVRAVHLAVGMPANERMDWLVEKATELGAASITPLVVARSVLRVAGDRAAKKQAHWQAIAAAASEQCGRNRVPTIAAPTAFDAWLAALPAGPRRLMLSPDGGTLAGAGDDRGPILALSGPEGGLTREEQAEATRHGFEPVRLGARVLRAETAPVALLARWAD